MATTSIWPVKGRVEKAIAYIANPAKTNEVVDELAAVLEYAGNPAKTEQCRYVSCLNCELEYAAEQFAETKRLWRKTNGRSCYHGYQSFAAGEVTAEQVHQIGVQLARELWGERFEVVVATHLNTDNLHNHFVLNAVSFADGKKFANSRADYAELLNSLDSAATVKLTICNHSRNKANFEQSVLMQMREDGLDKYRREYNQMLLDKATDSGGRGVVQDKYITVSIYKRNVDEARTYFARVGAGLAARFAAVDSKLTEINAEEKQRLLHSFYRTGEEENFHFNMEENAKLGHSFLDYICPDSIERYSDYLKIGEKYCRGLYLKDYASYIKDDFVTELTDIGRNMLLSVDVITIPTDEAIREVENRLLGVETNITNWQRKQNRNNNFSATIPYDMELQRRESKEFLSDLSTRDQRMMVAVLTLAICAGSKEELDAQTDAVKAVSAQRMCQMAVLKYQQMDGLNTVLPIGTRKINAMRTLTTESLAVLMPFKVQEIADSGGIYFGENAISHNLIMCNKENLLNQAAFLLGVPGSGKSFSAKELITFLILNTQDDILICDPEGEYAPLVEAMGDNGTVIRVAAGGRDRLNAMYMVEGYGDNTPIVVKSQFIMSLVERIDPNGVGPQHKSIIDRCTAAVYKEAEETGVTPTLTTLRQKLLEQPEEIAAEIALALELFTTGLLDIFGHNSTVDLDKRVIAFDIHSLGEQLKPIGHLVITDTIVIIWKVSALQAV